MFEVVREDMWTRHEVQFDKDNHKRLADLRENELVTSEVLKSLKKKEKHIDRLIKRQRTTKRQKDNLYKVRLVVVEAQLKESARIAECYRKALLISSEKEDVTDVMSEAAKGRLYG